MREFTSLTEFGLHLVSLEATQAVALSSALERVLVHIEAEAKAEIGHYQPAVGPFAAWAPLADTTEAEKARLGYDVDAPLERTLDLRDSISHQAGVLEGIIGSTSDVMVYEELGTLTIPPRAVLGPAAVRCRAFIEKEIGEAAVAGLLGLDRLSSPLSTAGVNAYENKIAADYPFKTA